MKKNVTLMLMWEEYKEKHPDGVKYTQFCERYRKFKKDNQISQHKEHKQTKRRKLIGPKVQCPTLNRKQEK